MTCIYKQRLRILLLSVSLIGITSASNAQTNTKAFWTQINERLAPVNGERENKPTKFRTLRLDFQQMNTFLKTAPKESAARPSDYGIEVQLPMPNGTWSRFKIYQTDVMHPDLAAKFPEIKTYAGQGIDDVFATIRLDATPLGFHAMVLSPDGGVFIDPNSLHSTADYICYYKRDLKPRPFICETKADNNPDEYRDVIPQELYAQKSSGANLRTYRLALAATGEYTAFFGGTVALGQAAIVTSMNRVSGVYETEVAIRMQLVANNSSIVYTNSATDPYTNGNGGTMLGQNQTTCDAVIGTANYDIGHVFSTGGGGVAGLGVVCSAGNKARGVTGSGAPVGDAYDIDYVAHEIGHQFGGNHTFNSVTGSCGGGNRNASTAMEPGSGITIMAYAGICSTDNIALNSIAYFHPKSFEEIVNFSTTGGGNACAATTATGNSLPVVVAGADDTIPISTPFILTGSATDGNGDPLTYSWEEVDVTGTGGSVTQTQVDNLDFPLFQSYAPVANNPSRTFPRLTDIINNTSTVGERLPSVNRVLDFRLTARDNRANGSGVTNNDVTRKITVSSTSGPFLVTAPNTAISWGAGTSQTVTWNVANTTSAPVSCANVKISLSTDGGNTFPTVLLASTPNDGSQNVTIPNSLTTTARIKVEAVESIFFDMSNANFSIVVSNPVVTAITTSALVSNSICLGGAVAVSFSTDGPATAGNYFIAQLSNSIGSFANPVKLDSIFSVNAGTINTIIPGGTPIGSGYRIRVVSTIPVVVGSNNGTNISIVAAPLAAGVISGSTSVCKGQTGVIYTVPSITNATGYTWTLPTSGSITAGANTNSITVTFSASASSGNVSVFGFNAGCNGASSTLGVTVITPIQTTGTQVFTNASGITINDNVAATPYPSTIAVSGITGLIQDVNVTITGLTHTYPDDIDVLLESPTGQKVTLMSDCGLGTDLTSVNLIIDDAAASNLPDGTQIFSGSYKPTNFVSPDTYPSPGPGSFAAPLGASSTALSTFNSLSPNGTWKLYVVDAFAVDLGSIASWTLTIVVPFDSSVISGTSSVCTGQNGVAYSIPAVANATGYNWSLPAGASIATGANTNSITVNYSGGAVSGIITVTPNNLCGNGIISKNFAVTVSACGCVVPPTANAGSTQTVCAGGTITLAGSIGGSATSSTWTAASGTFSNESSLTSNYTPAIASGTITLTLTTNDPDGAGACVAASSTVQIAVSALATANAGLTQTVCAGGIISLTGAIGGSATGSTWSAASGTFSDVSSLTSTYTPSIANGTILLTLTTNDPAGPCPAAVSTVLISVNACPSFFTLNLRVLFEGLYSVANDSMAAAADPSGNPAMADTITVELHDSLPPYNTAETKIGTISTHGFGNFVFTTITPGNYYYIVVKHRNSLDTWSKSAVLFDTPNVSFDFTTP